MKLEDTIETILGVSAEEVGRDSVSPEVMAQFCRKESILSSIRRTKMDYWLSYLAYFFDINYKVSWDIIREHDYVARLIARIPYSNPQAQVQMDEVRTILDAYMMNFTERI